MAPMQRTGMDETKKLSCVITGGTGLLGSHIAELLVEEGHSVRVLVRPQSDVRFLEHLGVSLSRGDLRELSSLQTSFVGADVVFHCAAQVGDWSPRKVFHEQVVQGTENVLRACHDRHVERVIYISSISVYGHPNEQHAPFSESESLGQNLRSWEHYARAKIQAEQLCRQLNQNTTILRPSWIYGPRDRNSLPRLINGISVGRIAVIDDGSKKINMVHARDVAKAALLCANTPKSKGIAYNICHPGGITHRQLLDFITDALEIPRIRRSASMSMAYLAGWCSEWIGWLIRMKRPPYVTRYGVGLIDRSTNYSIDRAREDLGWKPTISPEIGMPDAISWQLKENAHKLIRC